MKDRGKTDQGRRRRNEPTQDQTQTQQIQKSQALIRGAQKQRNPEQVLNNIPKKQKKKRNQTTESDTNLQRIPLQGSQGRTSKQASKGEKPTQNVRVRGGGGAEVCGTKATIIVKIRRQSAGHNPPTQPPRPLPQHVPPTIPSKRWVRQDALKVRRGGGCGSDDGDQVHLDANERRKIQEIAEPSNQPPRTKSQRRQNAARGTPPTQRKNNATRPKNAKNEKNPGEATPGA